MGDCSFDAHCPEDHKLHKLAAREFWVIFDCIALRVSEFLSDISDYNTQLCKLTVLCECQAWSVNRSTKAESDGE